MTRAKVLVVDDEVEFASALSERLQLRNYEAKAVYSAKDVLPSVKKECPDVVLLDLKMPGMSGIDVLKAIKQVDATIEVIILTGQGSIDEGLKGTGGSALDYDLYFLTDDSTKKFPQKKEEGIFDYVMKPVAIEDLVEKIDKAKKKRST